MSKLKSVFEAEQQMVDLRKIASRQKIKTLPSGQTSNRGWTKPSRYGKELKYRPQPCVSRQGRRHAEKPPKKRELYKQGRNSTGPYYIHLKGNISFRGP